jgi:uncharacterized membrane protein SpoIIM required for sporulation
VSATPISGAQAQPASPRAKPELQLKSGRFRAEREADWRRLERLLEKVDKGSLRALSETEIVEAAVLYRSALSSLSVARATSLDQGLVDYLEGLSTRAYFFVYGVRTSPLQRIARFFAHDWPLAAKALWRETLASVGLMSLGAVAAYVMTRADTDWYAAFVPPDMTQGRDFSASADMLRKGLYDSGGTDQTGLSLFATYLFTHNAGVALFAFALGFAFCLPTALLVAYSGAMLGAMMALYVSKGLGFEMGGWLAIHGVTELFAVTLAGAAGFRVGWTLAFPGGKSRAEAVGDSGRQAAMLMCGVGVMLFVAGLLEGIGRQTITSDVIRYAVAITSGVVWLAYLYLPRSRADAHG